MAVVCKKENGKDIIVYEPPVKDVLMEKSNQLVKQFTKYAKSVKLVPGEVFIQREMLPRIILRVDKRESYFLVFHKGTKINELKQAALMAYWVLKFKPFMIDSKDPERVHKYTRINEGFALFYILGACTRYAKERKLQKRRMTLRLRDEIMYAFTYWDLSKEALILIAETIGEAFYGIPAEGMTVDGHY